MQTVQVQRKRAMKEQMQEDLWRIREQADPADIFETEDEEDV